MNTIEESLRALVTGLVRDEVARQLAERGRPAEFLSTAAAAELAGVAAGTVRRWIREGRLTEHRAGRHVRVRRADLERLLGETRRRSPVAPVTAEARARRDFGDSR